MIRQLEIENFQSLQNVKVPLGNFTVILGPSNTGKSALIRAFKLLVSNQRGNKFITHGESVATVKAYTDKGIVSIARGKTTAQDRYVIGANGAEPETFTKLGGTAPEEVSEFLGIPSRDPINFAGQFDLPYLLKAPPSEVAQILGELTNVHVIFNAAKRAKSLGMAASQKLKTRAEDLAKHKERLEEFKPLKAKRAALEEAEEAISKAEDIQEELAVLNTFKTVLVGAKETISYLDGLLAVEVPDLSELEALANELDELEELQTTLILSKSEYKNFKGKAEALTAEELELTQEYVRILEEAGTCPVCHQSTKKKHTHSHAETYDKSEGFGSESDTY